MKKPIIFRLQCDLYPHSVVFYIGPKPKDVVTGRLCKKHGLWNGEGRTPNVGTGHAGTIVFGSGCLVWLDSFHGKAAPTWFKHLAHELVHVLSNASEMMGCYLDKNTDEFHAYYAGWITEQVVKRISRKTS